jgi:hypothetical protein
MILHSIYYVTELFLKLAEFSSQLGQKARQQFGNSESEEN